MSDSTPNDDALDLEALLNAAAPQNQPQEPPVGAQGGPQEPPAVPPASPPPPPQEPQASTSERLAESLALLMQRERELQEQRRKLEELQTSLSPLQKYQRVHERLEEQDPLAALEEMGISLTELNKAVAEGRGVRPTARLQREISSKLEEMERNTQARLAQIEAWERSRAEQEARAETRQHVAPERYPLTAATGDLGVEAVIAKFQEHYQRSGNVPSYDQVIGEVEGELAGFVDRLMRSEQVRGRYVQAQQTQVQAPQSDPVKPPSPTLTNSQAATVTARRTQNDLPMDRDDAIEAILSEIR